MHAPTKAGNLIIETKGHFWVDKNNGVKNNGGIMGSDLFSALINNSDPILVVFLG